MSNWVCGKPSGSIDHETSSREHGRALVTAEGAVIYKHACALGCEGIVSKRLGSPYRAGRSAHWLKVKNPAAPAVKREAEEEWQ